MTDQYPIDVESVFIEARKAFLESKLFAEEHLELLRERLDEALDGAGYCDGCGFCCQADVPMTGLEFARIEKLLAEDPTRLVRQGLVCPFLDVDRARFDRNLQRYGRSWEQLEPLRCRIYDERPLICRMFPAPRHKTCRKLMNREVPDLDAVLKQEDDEDFPQMLIQRYYITLDWENKAIPVEGVLDSELRFHLVPGWYVDRETQCLESREGPTWMDGQLFIPDTLPKPDSCELEDWAVDALVVFESPCSYATALERFSERPGPQELAELLTYAELANIIVPIDAAERHALNGHATIWDWLRRRRGSNKEELTVPD